jgi:antibiotic biosynthesis monooxygenase (ABM) superfamily enzyme
VSRGESLIQAALIWVCVCPSVLAFSYGIDALAPEWPRWSVILVSTLFTVAVISFLVTPGVERLLAWRRGQSHAALMLDRARAAAGPDPEDR